MDITFAFEELPLLTVNGYAAGLVNGRANITVHSDGEWFVKEIYLDGYLLKADRTYDKRNVEVEEKSGLYLRIWSELTDGSFKSAVNDAVQVAMEEDGFFPRSGASEHSTLNSAQV